MANRHNAVQFQFKMITLAHTENAVGVPQLLQDHLQSVGGLRSRFAKKSCNVLKDAAYWTGLLHDLGKYGDLFQTRLRSEEHGLDHWSRGSDCVETVATDDLVKYFRPPKYSTDI